MAKCGNPECACSTGIHEGMTFGSGDLDNFGFWEKPCRICAKNFDETVEQKKADILKEMGEKEGQKYLKEATWLKEKAWPYEHTDLTPMKPSDDDSIPGCSFGEDEPVEDMPKMYPTDIVPFLCEYPKFYPSRADARRSIQSGATRLNGKKFEINHVLTSADLIDGKFIITKGKTLVGEFRPN